MHDASLDRCQDFITKYLNPSERTLIADVGSYDVNGTYKHLFRYPKWFYLGIDIEAGPNVDMVVDSSMPVWGPVAEFPRGFDVVISGQCLEHVAKPWVWIKQVASLMKIGGLLWVTAPNTWPYHEHPIDAWRVWPDGMRALFNEAGLDCLEAFFLHTETVGVARKG